MSDKTVNPKKCALKLIDEPKKKYTKKTINDTVTYTPLQKMPITRMKSNPKQLVMSKSGHIPDDEVLKKLWNSINTAHKIKPIVK